MHPKYDSPIETRARNTLALYGLTVEIAAKMSRRELLAIPGFGTESLRWLWRQLEKESQERLRKKLFPEMSPPEWERKTREAFAEAMKHTVGLWSHQERPFLEAVITLLQEHIADIDPAKEQEARDLYRLWVEDKPVKGIRKL